MTDPNFNGHTKYGTLAGIITILLYNISTGDVIRSIVLAGIGAIASFLVSLALRYCIRKWQR